MSRDIKNIAYDLRAEITKERINEYYTKFYYKEYQSRFLEHLREELNDEIPLDHYRLETVYNFLEVLEERQDYDLAMESIEPDIYNDDLISWLSSNLYRAKYVNQLIEEGNVENIFSLLQSAQYREIQEINQAVYNFIDNELENHMEVEL